MAIGADYILVFRSQSRFCLSTDGPPHGMITEEAEEALSSNCTSPRMILISLLATWAPEISAAVPATTSFCDQRAFPHNKHEMIMYV